MSTRDQIGERASLHAQPATNCAEAASHFNREYVFALCGVAAHCAGDGGGGEPAAPRRCGCRFPRHVTAVRRVFRSWI